MRSFLTRLVDSVTQTVLLAPCLLICLACATPFPFENLETGMTAEAVRERFGEPEALETDPGGAESSWHYTHEEQNWGWTAYCILFAPFCALVSPVVLLDEGKTLFHLVGVDERSVVLYFEASKLHHWVTGDPFGYLAINELYEQTIHEQENKVRQEDVERMVDSLERSMEINRQMHEQKHRHRHK